jgi:membrane protease YdiL (CAAX protease family)
MDPHDSVPTGPGEDRRLPALAAVLFYGLLGVTAWAWLGWSHPGISERLWATRDWPQDLGAGTAAGLGIVSLSAAAGLAFRWARALEEGFRDLLGGLKVGEIALLAFLSGTAEEYFFRGALQEAFGVWVAAAVFAALHWPVQRRFLPWPFAAGAVGLLLGGLRIWTDSLVAPAAAHGVVNLVNLWRIARLRG